MRILYHHRTASRDGQSTHIEEMIRGLRAVGCVVEECSPNVVDHAPGGAGAGWAGQLKRVLPRAVYELLEIVYSGLAYARLARRIKQFRPDGIYERYSLFLLTGVWAKRRFGLPLMLEVNGPMAQERRLYGGLSWPWLADWAERYVWRNADLVFPITQVLADYLVTQGVEASRIIVIPNGINERHYAGLPTTEAAKARAGLSNRLVIGFTGFVREWDRLDRIVRWLARSDAAADAHLLVIGDGTARAEIEQCARELGVSDRVSFTGVVAREEVPALAMAFDIALQTALVPYASPLCLFEYLALSKAIVAPDQPNHHEILDNGRNALLFDPDGEQGIDEALTTLCCDVELRERIARGAGTVIRSKGLTWTQHASKVAAALSQLTRSPEPGRSKLRASVDR